MTSIDEHIDGFPPETQAVLRQLRESIGALVPDAVETISYGIPTFDLNGRHLVHFAGYEHHVGFYPTPSGMAAFVNDLASYESGKGSVRFPLDEPLPLDLIQRIVTFRAEEVRKQPQKKTR